MAERIERVVVTGARGEIATGLIRRLREEGLSVHGLEPGDDLIREVRDFAVDANESPSDGTTRSHCADAVVILDAVTRAGVDYERALNAVAEAAGRAQVKRLVSVVPVPFDKRTRTGFIERAEKAEQELIDGGYPLTVLRVGLVVGGPGLPAPADVGLMPGGKRMVLPGDGDQQVRPLLLDDLASVLIAALRSQNPPDKLDVEGPEQLSVRELVERFSPQVELRTHAGRSAVFWALVAAVVPLLYALTVLADVPTSDWSLLIGVVAGAIFQVFYFSSRINFTSAALPPSDLLLGEGPRTESLGVALRRTDELWDAKALADRKRKPAFLKAARQYTRQQGSFWIAGFLIVCGVGAMVVGIHDLAAAQSGLGSRVAGFTLGLVGAVVTFGGIALLIHWQSRYAFGFLASTVCLGTLVVLPLAALVNGDPPWWTLFAALYLIPAAFACCVLLTKRGGSPVGNVMTTRGPKILGSVILGGGVVTLFQLGYSSVYLPSAVTPSLSGEAQIAYAKPEGTAAAKSSHALSVVATVKLQNASEHAVTVLGAFYVVSLKRAESATSPVGLERDESTGTERMNPQFGGSSMAIAERGEVLEPGTSIERGEELTKRFLVPIPSGYSTASVRVDLALARHRYKQQESVSAKSPVTGAFYSVDQIKDPAWLHQLTRSTRYVHVLDAPGDELGCTPTAEVAAYVDNSRSADGKRWCQSPTELDEHYGVAVEQFAAEARLPD